MDIHEQVLNAFQVEHKEQIQSLRAILASVGHDVASPGDPRWNEAFRMAHTLKGGARVSDLRELEQLSHRIESLLAAVQQGTLTPNETVVDTIGRALDAIEDWMAALAEQAVPAEPVDALAAIERLLQEAKRGRGATADDAVAAPPNERRTADAPLCHAEQSEASQRCRAERSSQGTQEILRFAEDGTVAPPTCQAGPPVVATADSRIPTKDADTIRVRIDDLDAVMRSADELISLAASQDRIAGDLASLRRMISDLVLECESVRISDAGILRRLGADPEFSHIGRHLDSVVQQARRLSRQERHARTTQQSAAWSLGVLSESLRRDVQRARMVAAENVFFGLGPMVRSLARDGGREVEFAETGMETQADRRVLQALKDPLIQILRNAVVHGIEPPDKRVAAGKSRQGRITLGLRTEGNLLEIAVRDDGRGVDYRQVSKEAVRRGLISDADESRSGTDLARLLFQPGFTTCGGVDELAGRGMGLSIVQTAVARLQGGIDVQSQEGRGTAILIRVPLSISAQRLLLVGVAGQTFAIPTHRIDRLLRVQAAELQSLESRRIVVVDGTPVYVIHLGEFIGLPPVESTHEDAVLSLAVLRSGTQCVALQVETLAVEREALIRELDEPAASVDRFCGGMVLDDGSVALVLNVSQLLNDPTPAAAAGISPAERPRFADRPPTILIVDDSFTTRTLEKGILDANGYDVRVAVDGLEALACLRSEPIDLVVTDVEMPRLDGFGLLEAMKADSRLSCVPVLLVTSMDSREDQERGLSLGANAYILKRKFDHQELLGAIERFL